MKDLTRCKDNSKKSQGKRSQDRLACKEASKGYSKSRKADAQSKRFINKTEERPPRVRIIRRQTISSHRGRSTWQALLSLTIWTWDGTITTRTFACAKRVTDLKSGSLWTKMRPYSTGCIKRETVPSVIKETLRILYRSRTTSMTTTCRNPLESQIAEFTGRSLLRLWVLLFAKWQARYSQA